MTVFAPLVHAGQWYQARRLDVLVWNLEGLPKIQRLLADVTILVEALDLVHDIEVVVPFRVRRREDVQSINHQLVHNEIALPGASNVDAEAGEVTYATPDLGAIQTRRPTVLDIQTHDLPRGLLGRMSRRSSTWSVIRVHFETPVQPATRALVRLRFHIYGPTSIALWKRSGFGLNGALFEAGTEVSPALVSGNLRELLNERSAGVEHSSITFVLRASLQLKLGYPEDVRPTAVDGRSWEDYLGRAIDLRSEGALVAYSTISDTNGSARLFLDVSREFGLLPFGNFVRVALVTMLVLVFASAVGVVERGSVDMSDWFAKRLRPISDYPLFSGISAAALAALLAVLARIRGLRAALTKTRDRWHAFDRWFWEWLRRQRRPPDHGASSGSANT